MTLYVLLTDEQADMVRGPTSPGNALEPRQTTTGWALPLAVLTNHEPFKEFLNTLPQGEVEWPPVGDE